MKMRAFWDIVPFGLVEVDQRFRGAYFLHHHGDEISHSGESGKILLKIILRDICGVWMRTGFKCLRTGSIL
jgi:hypothetical protein